MKMGVRLAALAIAGVMVGALCLAVIAQDEQAAIPADAKYAGSKLCGMCHKDEKTAFAETKHPQVQAPEGTTTPWKYVTGWDKAAGSGNEPGVQCEACHGRGSVHVGAKVEEKKTLIINPMNLDDPQKITSICAQCHSRYTPKEGDPPVDFTPGEVIFDKIDLLPVEAGQPMQQVNEFVTSKHYTEKHMTCIQCHGAHDEGMVEHNLRKPLPDLCGQCHHEQADLAAHTKGKAKEGDTCATCHMPDGAHTFAKPAAQ
jgi:hypothetical protein